MIFCSCFFCHGFYRLLFFFLLFFSPILSGRKVDVYHTSTQCHYCGLSANLESRSEMCWMRLVEKYMMQKFAKNSPSAHHSTTLSGYIIAPKACIDNRKKNLLNSMRNSIRNWSDLPINTTLLVQLAVTSIQQMFGGPGRSNRGSIDSRKHEAHVEMHGIGAFCASLSFYFFISHLTLRLT